MFFAVAVAIGIGITILGTSQGALDQVELEGSVSSLTQNPTTAPASGWTAHGGADGGGFSSADGERYVLILEHDSKIRQTGTITEIDVETGASNNVAAHTGIYFQVYRFDGANYDLVDETSNLITEYKALGNSARGIITLSASDYLTAQEGDYMGVRMVGTATGNPVIMNTAGASSPAMVWLTSDPGDEDIDFGTPDGTSTSYLRIQYRMSSPVIVTLGASNTSGVPEHRSYIEGDNSTDSPTITWTHKIGNNLGVSTQNLGHGGANLVSDGETRLNNILHYKPTVAVFNYGSGDYLNGVSLEDYTNTIQSIADTAKANNITPIFLESFPRSDMNNTAWVAVDTYNDAMRNIATQDGVYFIDTRSAIGETRANGTAGNLWELQATYDSGDQIHMNAAGHTQVANLLSESLSDIFTVNGWDDIKSSLKTQSQAGMALLSLILVAFAAVIIIGVIKVF